MEEDIFMKKYATHFKMRMNKGRNRFQIIFFPSVGWETEKNLNSCILCVTKLCNVRYQCNQWKNPWKVNVTQVLAYHFQKNWCRIIVNYIFISFMRNAEFLQDFLIRLYNFAEETNTVSQKMHPEATPSAVRWSTNGVIRFPELFVVSKVWKIILTWFDTRLSTI